MPSRLAPNPILRTGSSDLLRDLDLTDDELRYLLQLADDVKRFPGEYATALAGKSIAWQISHDSGRAASGTLDQIHAVGGQLGVTCVPWALSVNVHGFYEYHAEDRFQGGSFGVSVAKKF